MNIVSLNKQLEAIDVDGKVFVDLDGLLEVLYNSCTYGANMAKEQKDAPMMIMVAGMTTLCDVIEKVHDELKNRLLIHS